MVRVIEIGLAKGKKKRCTCKKCGMTLEYGSRDMRYCGGLLFGYECIRCANCKETVILRGWRC